MLDKLSKYLTEPVKKAERIVIKRNGSEEPFDETKIEKWARNATRMGVSWKEIFEGTVEFLPQRSTTEEIHKTMINVCASKEDKAYSRVAARLKYAELRKNMTRSIGMNDKTHSFEEIYNKLRDSGIWCSKTIPEYKPEYGMIYESLYDERFEYWQIKQWMDKYSLKSGGLAIETPHLGAIGIAIAIHGDDLEQVKILTTGIIKGKVNLPTPVINGCRNGDWDSISCCVIQGGDSIDSIGVAEHVAYKMTAKKAGIGIRFDTRSFGDPVKNGATTHLGKAPIYATVDKAVKMFTQVTRGGSATVTYSVYDPEIMENLLLKSQRTPENKRIDKLDYSMAYDNNFLAAVINDTTIQTVSAIGTLGPVYKAREILKTFLTIRQETGRVFCCNLDEMNEHTPFLGFISQSNLCLEIALPTKPYVNMADLYVTKESEGEIAFCSLGALNVSRLLMVEYEKYADCLVRTINKLIDKAPMFTKSLRHSIRKRRSIGVGILGLANYLYKHDLSFKDTDKIEELAEKHYYYLLKASQKLAAEGHPVCEGIKKDWLPIDTKKTKKDPTLDWEALRGKPRVNSVLVAHMPTESSSVFSNAYNGLYPARDIIITKESRAGKVLFIGDPVKETAWDMDNNDIAKVYASVQAYTDQAISCDYYVVPNKHPGGKVPLGQLMKEWVTQAKLGNKTMYYQNTNDDNGGMFSNDKGCDKGGCTL